MTLNIKDTIGRRFLLKGTGAAIGLTALGYGLYKWTRSADGSAKLHPKISGKMSTNTHPRSGVKVSSLGMGCMRFPMLPSATSPRGAEIDEQAAFRLIDYALDAGLNYFDSAYFYHKGESEAVLGKALARHPRENYLIATKMPGRVIESLDQAKEIFAGQLKKCHTNYFDFYQLHAVMSVPSYKKVYEEMGVLDFLLEQKEKGVIRHLGWSFHGDCESLDYLLANNPGWDYAMLQLNYHDLLHQLVMPEYRKGIIQLQNQPAPADWMYARVKDAGIPIVVMEPLLGGRLARLSKKARQPLMELRPDLSPAAWAFRFVANLPGVLTVLSGMTNMEHLQENLQTFSPLEPFSAAENEALRKAVKLFLNQDSISCTTCGYCMPCPYGVDIPAIFAHYNRCIDDEIFPEDPSDANYAAKVSSWLASYDRHIPKLRQAAHCTGCGKCAEACPAMIRIPEELARLGKLEENFRNGINA